MKKGKFETKGAARKVSKKLIALALALVLTIGGVVGGTLAWLTDTSKEVKNTFTPSDINITLDESDDLDLQMVPGDTITKDPKATVLANSEDCYLFVEIDESANFDGFMTYAIADGWTQGTGSDGDGVPANVIYRRVLKSDSDQTFNILKDDKVSVKESVTKDMMDAIEADPTTYPTLTFTAYAVQLNGSNNTQFTAQKAWKTIHTPTAAPGFGTP